MSSTPSVGPHLGIVGDDHREQFLARFFDRLWDRYRQRVAYVRDYEQLVRSHNATFFNDHIALRTIASQIPQTGIATISRIFIALGYRVAGSYQFPDKALDAVHLQHANPQLPKVFISELQLWNLPAAAREAILRTVRSHRLPVSDETLAQIAACGDLPDESRNELLDRVLREFHELPWSLPERSDVEAVNKVSQYGAWVLVHGYNVNHFTSLINSHGCESLGDIDRTVAALRAAGVPTKADIEGAPGSRLRQTATEAVTIPVDVAEGGMCVQIPWAYAYFELAERGDVTDPDTGSTGRFEGFLGPQATHLFEMTRKK